MKQVFDILKNAVLEAKQHSDMLIEVVECNAGFTRDGQISVDENAPIQLRLVAYPRHAKDGSAAN